VSSEFVEVAAAEAFAQLVALAVAELAIDHAFTRIETCVVELGIDHTLTRIEMTLQ